MKHWIKHLYTWVCRSIHHRTQIDIIDDRRTLSMPDDIYLDEITSIRLIYWGNETWSASGWDKVWHSSGNQPDIETALRKLIVNRNSYFNGGKILNPNDYSIPMGEL